MLDNRVEKFYREFCEESNEKFKEDIRSFQNRFLQCHGGYRAVAYPPVVFTSAFIDELKEATEFLLSMIFSIPERIFENDYKKMIEYQGYAKEDAEYLLSTCQEHLIIQAKQLARPDFLLAPDGVKAIEMNIVSALGGIGLVDRYNEIFYRTELLHDLEVNKDVLLSSHPVAKQWADFLFRHTRSQSHNPIVMMAVLDDDELNQDNFNSFITYEVAHYLRMNGFRTVMGNIQDIDFKENGAFFRHRKIDIVLPSFIYIEARDAGALAICDKLIKYHREGHLTFYGSATSTIFDNKINLAILSSPTFYHCFTPEERLKIDKLIPKTRRLSDSHKEELMRNKDKLVLKSCISFGGNNIVIGNNSSQEEWGKAIERALESDEPYIVQELVESRKKRFAYDMLENEECLYDLCIGAFYFDEFAGIFMREKKSIDEKTEVINCCQGGKISIGFYTE